MAAEGFDRVIVLLGASLTELQQKTEPSDTQIVAPAPATRATLTNVAASASNVTLLAANAARKAGTSVFNDAGPALYLKCGATASTSSFTVKILGGQFYEFPAPVYAGVVDGIWDSASGNARITEIT